MVRESNDQIRKLLRTLHHNDDLIADAFAGGVELGDRVRNNRIDVLSTLRALKPQEEGVYRLNPRLREFIADYLVSYRAYQTLTRLTGTIHQARSLWREMRFRQTDNELSDWDSLLEQFKDTILDIVYSIERNLSLLHTLVSTQYGDVSSFAAKLRQNKYYINEISESLNEMALISRFAEELDEQALHAGLPEIRTLVRTRLTSRMLAWTSQIKDAQTTINRSLFEARRLEERVRKLSRVSHWLRQNKSASGFESTLEGAPDVLFRSAPISLITHIDVRSASDADRAILQTALHRLPPRPTPRRVEESPAPLAIIDDEDELEVEAIEPHDVLLEALLSDLRQTSQGLSLRLWKEQNAEDATLSDEEWLLYASIQLENEGVKLAFVPHDHESVQSSNEVSVDVIAQGLV